jgi:hypothetical protein
MTLYHLFAFEVDAAAACYEKAIEQHELVALLLNAGALFKPLRESPRWPVIAKMMKLPDAQQAFG